MLKECRPAIQYGMEHQSLARHDFDVFYLVMLG